MPPCRHRRNEKRTSASSLIVFASLLLCAISPAQAFAPYPPSFLYKKSQQMTLDGRMAQHKFEMNMGKSKDDGYDGLGEYDPSENIRPEREVVVGDPQIKLKEKERSVTSILKELAAIQQQGPQKYCILGTRHCSYLHQQIIELL